MRDSDERDCNPKHCKGIKKPCSWPDHFSWMVTYARKLVGSNDAEDIANKALYDAYRPDRPRPTIDSDEALSLLRHLLWLRAREHWRNEKRHRAEVPGPVDFDVDGHEFDVAKRSDVMLDRIVLDRALARLSATDRQLVLGYYICGFTADELAQNHRMNESTVRSRIARSLTKLAEAPEIGRCQTRTSRGELFLMMELVFRCLSKLNVASKMRQSLGRMAKPVCGIATCTASLVPLALISSDVIDERTLGGEMFVECSAPTVSTWNGGRWVLAISMNTAHADPDRTLPSANPVVRMKIRTGESAIPTLSPNITNEISPVTNVPVKLSPNDRCNNAFGLALAESNTDEPRECVAILDRHQGGADACAETLEWSRLRAECREAISKTIP